MKFNDKVTKDSIRVKLSKAYGSDIGEVHPDLFFPNKTGIAWSEFIVTSRIANGNAKAIFYQFFFNNGKRNRLMATFSAS